MWKWYPALNVRFLQENMVLWKNKRQGIFTAFMLASLVNIHCFCAWGIQVCYGRHDISEFPIFYSTTTWSKFPTFVVALNSSYVSNVYTAKNYTSIFGKCI